MSPLTDMYIGVLMKRVLAAQFKVNVRGYTTDDDDMVCLDLMMDFRPKRGSFLSW